MHGIVLISITVCVNGLGTFLDCVWFRMSYSNSHGYEAHCHLGWVCRDITRDPGDHFQKNTTCLVNMYLVKVFDNQINFCLLVIPWISSRNRDWQTNNGFLSHGKITMSTQSYGMWFIIHSITTTAVWRNCRWSYGKHLFGFVLWSICSRYICRGWSPSNREFDWPLLLESPSCHLIPSKCQWNSVHQANLTEWSLITPCLMVMLTFSLALAVLHLYREINK